MPKTVQTQEISHAVLSNGGPVLAAGEADIAGSSSLGYFGADITDHSGHFYKPGWDARDIGIIAFGRAGIFF